MYLDHTTLNCSLLEIRRGEIILSRHRQYSAPLLCAPAPTWFLCDVEGVGSQARISRERETTIPKSRVYVVEYREEKNTCSLPLWVTDPWRCCSFGGVADELFLHPHPRYYVRMKHLPPAARVVGQARKKRHSVFENACGANTYRTRLLW